MIPETEWITTFLQTLGIQPTQNNIDFVTQWIQSEGPYGSQYNPLNAFGAASGTTTASAVSVANWAKTNGNFGSLGTYASELQAFLTGAPNNISQSLAYWSGHAGDSSQLTTSYQNLIANFSPGGGGYSEGTTAVSPGTTATGSASNLASGWGSLGGAPSWLQGLFQNAGWLLVAITLIIGGIIWLAISEGADENSTTNKVARTTRRVARSAAIVTGE